VAAMSYVSTNSIISSFFRLTAPSRLRPLYVKLTFICVCLTVALRQSHARQAADNSVSAKQVRYLGLIPIALGGYQLLKLMMGRVGSEDRSVKSFLCELGVSLAFIGFSLMSCSSEILQLQSSAALTRLALTFEGDSRCFFV